MNDLTVALPAYNEEATIAAVIDECCTVLDPLSIEYELLVIDNLSTDRTVSIVRQMMKSNPRLRLIEHTENFLYSGSCFTAMQEHGGSRLVIMDSDGQMDPSDIPDFVAKLDSGFDVVFGSRTRRQDPPFRLFTSQVFNLMGRLYLRFPFKDLNCGMRAMSDRATKSIAMTHRINMANPEIYVRAVQLGLDTAELAVRHRPRIGGETSHDFGKLWRIFRDVEAYFRSLRREMNSSHR